MVDAMAVNLQYVQIWCHKGFIIQEPEKFHIWRDSNIVIKMGKSDNPEKAAEKKARREKRKSEVLASLPVDSALVETTAESHLGAIEAEGVQIIVKVSL